MFRKIFFVLLFSILSSGIGFGGTNDFEIQMVLRNGPALDESSAWFRMTMQEAGILGSPEQVGPLNKIDWGGMNVWMKGYRIVGFSMPELPNIKEIYEPVRAGSWGRVKSDKEDCWNGRILRKGKEVEVFTWWENGERFYMVPEGAKLILRKN